MSFLCVCRAFYVADQVAAEYGVEYLPEVERSPRGSFSQSNASSNSLTMQRIPQRNSCT